MNRTCPRCGAEVPQDARFCVMCGFKVEAPATQPGAALPYGTSTLTGAGLVVSIAAAAIAACIVVGVIVLVQQLA